MFINLSRSYVARDGAPVIDRVDPRIFTLTYFGRCMSCDFCDDSCCRFGADVEIAKVQAIKTLAGELEAEMKLPREEWFRTDPEDIGFLEEPEYPGGEYTRTSVVETPAERSGLFEEACVFLDPVSRGCRLHRFALEKNIEVHEIKPLVCNLFPLCFAKGELHPALELETDELICQGPGESLYRSVRGELSYYFGEDMVRELDVLDSQATAESRTLVSLPMHP